MNRISLIKSIVPNRNSLILPRRLVSLTPKRYFSKTSLSSIDSIDIRFKLGIELNNKFQLISTRYNSNKVPETQDKIKIEGRLAIRFTCKVCQHVNMKTMSKQAYQEGVVLIQCDGCDNRHLIADNLGWFRDNRVNIEDLARENGEKLARFDSTDPSLKGLFEFTPPSESELPKSIGDKSES